MTRLEPFYITIVSKYFVSPGDFINITLIARKFKDTFHALKYNPIQLHTSSEASLFPNLETQHIYSPSDYRVPFALLEVWEMATSYDTYLDLPLHVSCRFIEFTKEDRMLYGNEVPSIPELKRIGISCYRNCPVRSLTTPQYITSLGEQCFMFCTRLTSVVLSDSIKELPSQCFYHCLSLRQIRLPSNLLSAGDDCFRECLSLESITMPCTITSLGYRCFSKSALTQIDLHECTQLYSLPIGCFCGCPYLCDVFVNSSLSVLSKGCFCDCIQLSSIVGLSDAIQMKQGCLCNCRALTGVYPSLTRKRVVL